METIKNSTLEEHQYLIDSNPYINHIDNSSYIENDKQDLSKEEAKMKLDKQKAEENLYEKMCMDLPLYQDKIKRDKTLYREEFLKFLNVFIPKFNTFLQSPAQINKSMKEVIIFLSHLSHIFTKELSFLPKQLKELLEHSHAIIQPDIRLGIIEGFNLMRKKDIISPIDILPLFFQLLTLQDKELRQKIQDIIVNDLQRVNEKAKNHGVNKFMRNKCGEMLQNPNFKAARKTLNIIVLLYKKKVWNDDKTVNVIAQACYNKDSKIAYAAAKFFLSEYEEQDEESENEMGDLKQKFKLLGKGNNKKTKKRKEKIKTLMKAVERREHRKAKVKENKDFMPIDLINDPSTLCEKMYDRIKGIKNKKHYKLKIVLIRLIGRIAGRHKIIINNFFPFCATLVRPKQDELSTILAAVIEAVHHMVSSQDLTPIINELFDYFICESFPPQYITIGVNTLREMVGRCHSALKVHQFSIISDLKKVKNKSVSTAVRAFINMCRDVCPQLLDGEEIDEGYTNVDVKDGIEGVDLLKLNEGIDSDYKLECNELLTDNQLKKLRLLKLKANAEAVQRIRLNLTNNDISKMLGEKRENRSSINAKSADTTKYKGIINKKKSNKNELNLNENSDNKDEAEEIEDEEDEVDEDSNLSVCSDFDEMEEVEDEEGDEENENIDDEEEEYEEDEEDENSEINAVKELDDLLNSKENKDKQNISDSEEEEESVNSFIEEGALNNYKWTRKERKGMNLEDDKQEFKLTRKKKKAGQKTNVEARKNKPIEMVIHKVKRNKLKKENDKNLAHRIKNIKRQLGRFKRGNMVLKKKGADMKKTKKKLSKRNKGKV